MKWLDKEVVHDRKDSKISEWQQAQCSACGRWLTTPYLYYFTEYEYCPRCGERRDDEERNSL